MSQLFFNVSSNCGNVEVLVGWDEPLKVFFLTIGVDLEEPYYSTLYEPMWMNPYLTLDYYQGVLEFYEINDISLMPDSELFLQLMDDQKYGRQVLFGRDSISTIDE